MARRCLNVLILAAAGAVCICGCTPGQERAIEPVNPLADANVVVPKDVSRAIAASGGTAAWMQRGQIEARCVVTFYGDCPYITEHRYSVSAWPGSIRIEAKEPQGAFVRRLSAEGFSSEGVSQGPVAVRGVDEFFAEAVLDVMTAPLRVLEGTGEAGTADRVVKIGTSRYRLIEKRIQRGGATARKVVFYQDVDSGLIDTIWLADSGNARLLGGGAAGREDRTVAVRGYDYRKIAGVGVRVPSKIELFGADYAGGLHSLLVRIDCRYLGWVRQVEAD